MVISANRLEDGADAMPSSASGKVIPRSIYVPSCSAEETLVLRTPGLQTSCGSLGLRGILSFTWFLQLRGILVCPCSLNAFGLL